MFNFLIRYSQSVLTAGILTTGVLTTGVLTTGVLTTGVLTTSVVMAIAQPSHGIAAPAAQAVSRRRPPRPPRRLPPNQVQPGGGLDASVQSCDPNSSALTALVPVANPVFTASAHPTFLFYLPDAPEQVEYAEFMLLGADEKEEIYATRFVPTSAGVVSLSLPEDSAHALEVDQAYHWYFNLHCKTAKTDDESTPAVNGWVQRLDDAESGDGLTETGVPEVWYDAIAQVAETLAAGPMPQNPTAQSQFSQSQLLWETWLSAVGLDEVVNAPVVGPVLSQQEPQ